MDFRLHPVDWNDPDHPLQQSEPRKGQRAVLAATVHTPQGPLLCYCLHMEVVLFYSSEADISTCCVCLLSFRQLLVQVCTGRAQCQIGCPMLTSISVNAEQMNQSWNLLAKPSWFHVACHNTVCCVCSCFVVCWRVLSSLLMSCGTASYRSRR